jgi:hypothetical protein
MMAMPASEAAMSALLTSGLYGGIDDIRRKLGVLPDFLP